MVVNENSNPNGGGKLPNNDNSMMKFGGGGGGSGAAAETRRPPPPRASLTTSRPKFNRSSPSIIAPSQANTNTTSATETLANDASVSNRSALVLNVTDNSGAVDEKEEDLALWVVGYGKLLSIAPLHSFLYISTLLCSFVFRNSITFFSNQSYLISLFMYGTYAHIRNILYT
jgi:hypothetical protein